MSTEIKGEVRRGLKGKEMWANINITYRISCDVSWLKCLKMPWYKIIDIYSWSLVAWIKVSINIYYMH